MGKKIFRERSEWKKDIYIYIERERERERVRKKEIEGERMNME